MLAPWSGVTSQPYRWSRGYKGTMPSVHLPVLLPIPFSHHDWLTLRTWSALVQATRVTRSPEEGGSEESKGEFTCTLPHIQNQSSAGTLLICSVVRGKLLEGPILARGLSCCTQPPGNPVLVRGLSHCTQPPGNPVLVRGLSLCTQPPGDPVLVRWLGAKRQQYL